MINFVCLYYIKTTNHASLYVWWTLHCSLYIVLHTANIPLNNKWYTPHIAHCSLYTKLYSNQNTKYWKLDTEDCKLQTVHLQLPTAHFAAHFTELMLEGLISCCILHTAPVSLKYTESATD